METVEVDKLEGRELDAVIQIRIFGSKCARSHCRKPGSSHIVSGVIYCSQDCADRIGDFDLDEYDECRRQYSQRIEDAWLIVEKLSNGSEGYNVKLYNDTGGIAGHGDEWGWEFVIYANATHYAAWALTVPLAICRAALHWAIAHHDPA